MANSSLATTTSHRLLELSQHLQAAEGFAQLREALRQGKHATIEGVWGSACALTLAELSNHTSGTVVIVVSQQTDIDSFLDDLSLFTQHEAVAFPAWQSDPGDRIIHDEVYGQRLRTLKRFAKGRAPKLLATSIESILQPCPSRENVAENTRQLSVGETVDVAEFLRWLATHRFHTTSAVELPGEFSARGGLVDVFAADWDRPVRIEFFGDEVESLRTFDISSQRSVESLDELDITVLAPSQTDRDFLTSYLPDQSWILLAEPEQLQQEGKNYLTRLENPTVFHSVAAVMKQISRFAIADVSSIAPASSEVRCRLDVESVERFSGEFGKVKDELDRVGLEHEVFVVCDTAAEIERLTEILAATKLAAAGRLNFVIGSLDTGFRMTRERILVVSGRELFQRGQVRRSGRRHQGKAIDSFLELREGDLVVHLAHGIGRYRGLELLDKEGHVEEHLTIEFHGGTRIYVPAG